MTTTIVKWGNSRGIRLPKPFLESLQLQENDTVEVFTDNDSIVIKKAGKYPYKTLKQTLEEFHGKDLDTILREADENPEMPVMVDWGKPVGTEVW